jgi:hypothetical protein
MRHREMIRVSQREEARSFATLLAAASEAGLEVTNVDYTSFRKFRERKKGFKLRSPVVRP